MHDAALKAWESFYVIVGSSAGALTGLQFVVLTLISESGRIRGSAETLSAFGSPTVVHFCLALLVSAILSTPWHGLGPAGVAVAFSGVGGFIYSVAVLRRALRQRDYRPVLEDWIWHAVLPILAYAALALGGLQVSRTLASALFVIGGATLLLVFVGIHNAWDTVTYVMVDRAREKQAGAAGTTAAGSPSVSSGRAPHPATRSEIVAALESNAESIATSFSPLPDTVVVTGDPEHWGPAHHLVHLTMTSKAIARGLRSGTLPLHPAGRSRSYGELIEVATTSLASASKEQLLERGRAVVVAPGASRSGLVEELVRASAELRAAAEAWRDEDLDRHALTHPYMGTLTVREMLLFCVFHERHHLKRVRASLGR